MRLIAGNGGFEDVRGADPLHTPECLFLLQPVDHRPYRSECRSSLFWQGLVDLADGTGAARPQHLHDAEFEPAQCRTSCHLETTMVADLTTYVAATSRGESGARNLLASLRRAVTRAAR